VPGRSSGQALRFHCFFIPEDIFKTRGVIAGLKTPWKGDTTNQALVASKNKEQ
jgi:hypothetical protein